MEIGGLIQYIKASIEIVIDELDQRKQSAYQSIPMHAQSLSSAQDFTLAKQS